MGVCIAFISPPLPRNPLNQIEPAASGSWLLENVTIIAFWDQEPSSVFYTS